MYIETVPNRSSPPAVLLRESFRDGAKIKKRTLCNLSRWPKDLVEGLRTLLKGGTAIDREHEAVSILRSLPHGHVVAVLGCLRRLRLERVLARTRDRQRDLVLAMICARLIAPASKLATARALDGATAASTLGQVLDLGAVDEDDLYAALDWLVELQPAIEARLARKHLADGALVLYDVSSSYMEGRCCPLAAFGYNRDGKADKMQIVYGLICAADGCPVAIQVFEGNTSDAATVGAQIDTLRTRFGLKRVVLVGDRGLLTQARLDDDVAAAGFDWITALRAPAIRKLVDGGALQLDLFDERDMASISSPDYPGERLIVCRNPALATERARKREDLLAATERDLQAIRDRVERRRRPLRGAGDIGKAVGAVQNRRKVGKHFETTITDDGFAFARKQAAIAAEAALDGIYVIHTSVPETDMDDAQTVRSYKGLAVVERAFRCLKTVDIEIRPVFHWTAPRVRAHVFLCMLAYYVEWHMRQALAPMLFDDADKAAAEALRDSVVAKAQRSPEARRKEATHRTDDGLPVHSFRSLLNDLATLSLSTVATAINEDYTFTVSARPTPVQQKAFDLLGVNPGRTQ